jgi:hypothetical protein
VSDPDRTRGHTQPALASPHFLDNTPRNACPRTHPYYCHAPLCGAFLVPVMAGSDKSGIYLILAGDGVCEFELACRRVSSPRQRIPSYPAFLLRWRERWANVVIPAAGLLGCGAPADAPAAFLRRRRPLHRVQRPGIASRGDGRKSAPGGNVPYDDVSTEAPAAVSSLNTTTLQYG